MSPILCRVADLPDDNGLEREVPGPLGIRRLVLFRTPLGIRAYLNVCPHQGRSLDFAPGDFLIGERGELICPHHGACFELAEGTCISGPCQGDRLTPVPVTIVEDMVYLDAGD